MHAIRCKELVMRAGLLYKREQHVYISIYKKKEDFTVDNIKTNPTLSLRTTRLHRAPTYTGIEWRWHVVRYTYIAYFRPNPL